MKRSRTLRAGFAAALVACAAFLGGCATTPATSVILLPDEDGHVGAVSIYNTAGEQRLSDGYGLVTVDGAHAAPARAAAPGQPAVESRYADLLKAQPSKPRTFVLHFLLDSTTLTDDSRALLAEVLSTARARKPTEISVFGHADASGTEEHNTRLSAERARVVADLLRKSDPSLDHIDVQYFGDRAPAVQSEAHAPDARNRRAEVLIL